MKSNKLIKNISKALLIGAFLVPFNLMAQGPTGPGDTQAGGNTGDCTDPDVPCPIDNGTVAIVVAGLAIGTFMLIKNKNTAFYQAK